MAKLSTKNVGKFFKDMRTELKKVIWPDRKQLTNNTLTVLLMCFIVGAFIWVTDYVLGLVTENFLFK